MKTLPVHCDNPATLVSYTIDYVKDGSPVTNPNIISYLDPLTYKIFNFYSTDPSDAGTYVISVHAWIPIEQSPGNSWWSAD